MTETVSVFIPFKQQTVNIEQCLHSVFQQTMQRFHVYFVNLSGSDEVISELAPWQQQYPTQLSYVEPSDLSLSALNSLIAGVETEYVAILPSDDYWADDFLATLTAGLDALPDVMLAYSDYAIVDNKSNQLENLILKPHTKSSIVDDSDVLLFKPWICLASSVFRQAAFEKVGGFNPIHTDFTEHVVWLQMASESAFYFCDTILAALRKDEHRAFDKALFMPSINKSAILLQDTLFFQSFKLKAHAGLISKCLQISLMTKTPLYGSAKCMIESHQLAHLDLNEALINDFLVGIADIILSFDRVLHLNNMPVKDMGTIADGLKLLEGVLEDNPEHEKAKSLSLYYAELQLNVDYQQWVNNHAIREVDIQMHAERMSLSWATQPTYHFVMFLFEGDENKLADTIDSLSQQFYPNWHLSVIADSAAPDPMFDELAVLSWHTCTNEINPYDMANHLFTSVKADYISFIPAGMQVEPQSLLHFTDYFNLYPEVKAFYSDDDLIADDGERHSPRFKPDFNLEMLRSMDYINVAVFDKSCVLEMGGIGVFPLSENRDLLFKLYERSGAGAIGHISDVLVHLPDYIHQRNSVNMSAQVVGNHFKRLGVDVEINEGYLNNTLQVDYQLKQTPLVSIIIPTKDKLEYLRPCIDSVIKKTTYEHYELIIVNNESQDPDTLAYLTSLSHVYPSTSIRVIDYPYPFNYAAISNLAVEHAEGEFVLFLNNDIKVLQGNWLTRMMTYGLQQDVGVVGARLVYPETGVINHAGVVLGMNTIAAHLFRESYTVRDPGYMGRAQIAQDFSAVTAACMLVNKSVYNAVEGMDETNFGVLFNDLDLCLKIGEKGLRVVWTPYTTLVHHGSATLNARYRDSDSSEQSQISINSSKETDYFIRKWMRYLANDPAYNRHLSLTFSNAAIESIMPCNWDVNFHDRQRILGLPLSGGSGEYRVIHPLDALSFAGLAQCEYYRFGDDKTRDISLSEFARLAPDTIIFHAAVNDIQLGLLKNISTYMDEVFCIYTIDDLLTNVPEQSAAYKDTQRYFSDAKARLRKGLSYCDRLVVSTQPLADLCTDMIDDIRVVPNRLKSDPWASLTSLRNQSDKPRVGWAGAQQHQGDLAVITEVVKQTANEVDWIFMGMCPDELRPFIKEFHDFVAIERYPQKLASLNLDLAVAPLEFHPFNESKSNLRLLEYGALGWPVICTDIYPYQTDNAPVTLINNQTESWVEAIRDALANPDKLHHSGDRLKKWVLDNYIIEEHLDEWMSALVK